MKNRVDEATGQAILTAKIYSVYRLSRTLLYDVEELWAIEPTWLGQVSSNGLRHKRVFVSGRDVMWLWSYHHLKNLKQYIAALSSN
ncbi:MAG TPA: hypothetical protein DCR13_01870 [Gammaproteobacteria bacterium]|nr:hypothetical protein [Gammaproteobacteria bacterium]